MADKIQQNQAKNYESLCLVFNGIIPFKDIEIKGYDDDSNELYIIRVSDDGYSDKTTFSSSESTQSKMDEPNHLLTHQELRLVEYEVIKEYKPYKDAIEKYTSVLTSLRETISNLEERVSDLEKRKNNFKLF